MLIVLLAAALAAAFAPLPSGWVERAYSRSWYARLEPILTRASNQSPIAVSDALVVASLVGVPLWIAARIGQKRRVRSLLLTLTTDAAAAISTVYLVFLMCWGLNYRRVPLVVQLGGDRATLGPDVLGDLAHVAIRRVNTLHRESRSPDRFETGRIDAALAGAFARAQRALQLPALAPAVPRRSWLNGFLTRAGVEGFTDPFLLETIVQEGLLPFERPFVIAHEWGHLAGLARESEASALGVLTCLRADAPAQYSAWLFLLGETASGLPAAERSALYALLAEGPRADLRATADRQRRQVVPWVADAGWRVYDRYLRANRVGEGIASYTEAVALMLEVPAIRSELLGRGARQPAR